VPWYKRAFARRLLSRVVGVKRIVGIPDLSVIWVIFFVLLLVFLLNALLFQPVLRVMNARQSAVKAARSLADKAATDARQAGDAFDEKTRAARQEIARQMDETRRAAEAERTRLLDEAHAQAHSTMASATQQLGADAAEARQRIDRESAELAHLIADRVLGRQTT
jgi:F-type H+-transporting ATPase subunit b